MDRSGLERLRGGARERLAREREGQVLLLEEHQTESRRNPIKKPYKDVLVESSLAWRIHQNFVVVSYSIRWFFLAWYLIRYLSVVAFWVQNLVVVSYSISWLLIAWCSICWYFSVISLLVISLFNKLVSVISLLVSYSMCLVWRNLQLEFSMYLIGQRM